MAKLSGERFEDSRRLASDHSEFRPRIGPIVARPLQRVLGILHISNWLLSRTPFKINQFESKFLRGNWLITDPISFLVLTEIFHAKLFEHS